MANAVISLPVLQPETPKGHSLGRALLLSVPMALWTLLVFSRVLRLPGPSSKVAGTVTSLFLLTLFFLMLRTGETHRWRRLFFVALGFLFPLGFIWQLLSLRGTMSISLERMMTSGAPFCFLAIPMVILPVALTKTVIFPGAILPTTSNPHAMASMVSLWLVGTLVLGKAWCSYGCFFGGIEEGFASALAKPRIRRLNPAWRYGPWAVLVAIVLVSLASFEPVYCTWLCPFKAVTEFPEVRSLETAIQTVIFVTLFILLVMVLPLLTRRRTQCAFFCPFGAFQSVFNRLSPFELRIDRDRCRTCAVCQRACPTMALSQQSIEQSRTLSSCMRCGACVDQCPRSAIRWHLKGTPLSASPETARLLFLFPAWGFATMFGGNIIAGTLTKLIHLWI